MWSRAELKSKAKMTFKSNYWPCVLISFILLICTSGSGMAGRGGRSHAGSSLSGSGFSSSMSSGEALAIAAIIIGIVSVAFIIAILLKVFVFNILAVGARRFYIENQIEKAAIGSIIFSFQKGRYMNTLVTVLLKNVFIFLWSLLLVIPGIIKGYSYFMVDYIIAENPNIDRSRAFEISKQTMDGQKWNAFVLDLSFIGWIILTLFTCGILGIFYTNPYIDSTKAQLYITLRNIALDTGIASHEELCGVN